jgi:hypothetical protein
MKTEQKDVPDTKPCYQKIVGVGDITKARRVRASTPAGRRPLPAPKAQDKGGVKKL